MRVVGRVHALPELGKVGSLSDLETSLVEYEPPPGALVTTQLWVAPHTPASVLAKIRAQGVGLSAPHRLAGVLHGLNTDAFSLGFRVFLVVDLATLLLAILGVFVSAVLQARWRSYEVASLRVVGVPQRSLLCGSMLEYVVMLGLAVLFGLVSAYLSLLLVLPSMSLGTADPDAPAPIYAVHWAEVAGVGLALFALAAVIALVVSQRITRLGRPSTLRWAEQG
jgi:predicted lysophospholipase L1 biosynthesis ABC-type transport system permease subunit